MDVEFAVVVSQETVRLVASMVLSAESPVNVVEYWLVFVVDGSEDSAAYPLCLLT